MLKKEKNQLKSEGKQEKMDKIMFWLKSEARNREILSELNQRLVESRAKSNIQLKSEKLTKI